MAREFFNEITKTHLAEEILPAVFLLEPNKQNYQYIVALSWDREERQRIIEYIDKNNLDLITVINDTSLIGHTPAATIGPGTFIFPFCNISIASHVGRHCIIGSYSLIGHYSGLGDNCELRPGVMINGKSQIGKNCLIETKATITNRAMICDAVDIMAFSEVRKDITESGRYVGKPARRITQLDDL